jgi:hypothetical protein
LRLFNSRWSLIAFTVGAIIVCSVETVSVVDSGLRSGLDPSSRSSR